MSPLDAFIERLNREWAASGPPMDDRTAEAVARALLPASRRIDVDARNGVPMNDESAHEGRSQPAAKHSTDTVPQRTDSAVRRHSSPFCRWLYFDMNRRRREHAEFKALLARLEPDRTP